MFVYMCIVFVWNHQNIAKANGSILLVFSQNLNLRSEYMQET